MSNELKDCPFCGCKMIVRSNRDWHQPEGDHNELCPVYESDLMFPATDQGLSALYAMWNMRPSSTPVASAAPSGVWVGTISSGDIDGDEIDWDVEFDCKVVDALPQLRVPNQHYGLFMVPIDGVKYADLAAYAQVEVDDAAIAHQPPKEALTPFAFEDNADFMRRLDILLNTKYPEMRKDALARKISELANEYIHGYHRPQQLVDVLRHDELFGLYAAKLKERGYTSIEADSFGLMAVAEYAIAASAPNKQLVAAASALLKYLDEHDWGGVPEGATSNAFRAALTAVGEEMP